MLNSYMYENMKDLQRTGFEPDRRAFVVLRTEQPLGMAKIHGV